MDELVSIITPLYNSEKYISEAIESVINQTYTNWEMIIIDDYSTDFSFKIAKKYANEDKRILLIANNQNLGVSATRNKGIKKAKGRLIAFLDADDLWLSGKLGIQVSYMIENNISFSYTGYEKIDSNGSARGTVVVPEVIDYNQLLKSNFIGCLTVIYDSSVIKNAYFSNVKKSEDYLLWLEIIKNSKYAYGINTTLAKYRVLDSSRSSDKVDAIKFQWKIYFSIEKLGLFRSLYYFINYLHYGYKRYKI